MKKKILVSIPELENITIELNDTNSPKTCKSILDSLPFSVNAHVWGEEIYTDESPISQSEENAKSLVDLNDVAYWPSGKAICLFFGPTPIGKKGEIKPYSPVNVVGKITDPDKSILKNFNDGTKISFKKIN
ncbi:hypothetical protein HX837_02890 [Marine Group I thaumarchaeote]|uniref:Cyclophilin TM1367-like domain-containing protein n=1 Tax=Marine Group I thaumarchaeote TaxID=2511932 RepID=A0A7K4MNJ2_9ARCH|nr:hypothetical protein [Marine Group I thaumarchaeote]